MFTRMSVGYESFFGLTERPFSLTPDTKFFFRSRSHGRALETLTFALRARERFLLVTGDLGVGKTAFCHALVEQLRRRTRVAYIANPLTTPDALDWLVAQELGLPAAGPPDGLLDDAVIVVDEAHAMSATVLDHVLLMSRRHANADQFLRIAFVGQASAADPSRLGLGDLDDRVSTRARLLPLNREECAAYIEHRLTVAGATHLAQFSSRAHDYVFTLSGGVARLINLLCERALQEAAAARTTRIEPDVIDSVAADLQLLRARPRRFRWYSKRVS
jgi:type II secretory pathway predicted ATPase ExeA